MRNLGVTDAPFHDLGNVPRDGVAHVRIESWLSARVADGSLRPGDRLPPEKELAHHLGVSRMTLRQALAHLESQSLLVRRRGAGGGTFVTEPKVDCDLTGTPGFTEQMRRSHRRPGAVVVTSETVPADETVAKELGLLVGDPVHRVLRVRLADETPIALEDTWLPAQEFPGLLDHELTGSLYELMDRGYDRRPAVAVESIEPARATAEQARLLEAEPGALLMRITRTARTRQGVAVEHAVDDFRADRARITLRSTIGAASR